MFLRVVIDESGVVDALDQLDDHPKQSETVIAYRRVKDTLTNFHLRCGRESKLKSGWYQAAQYRVIEQQPSEETLRDTAKWQAWCMEQVE
jgi:hypothetical protein